MSFAGYFYVQECPGLPPSQSTKPKAIISIPNAMIYQGDIAFVSGLLSDYPNGEITKFEWNIQTPSSGTKTENLGSFSFIFAETGYYNFTLTVYSSEGEIDITKSSIMVRPETERPKLTMVQCISSLNSGRGINISRILSGNLTDQTTIFGCFAGLEEKLTCTDRLDPPGDWIVRDGTGSISILGPPPNIPVNSTVELSGLITKFNGKLTCNSTTNSEKIFLRLKQMNRQPNSPPRSFFIITPTTGFIDQK